MKFTLAVRIGCLAIFGPVLVSRLVLADCEDYYNVSRRGTREDCDRYAAQEEGDLYVNFPILNGVHCSLDGSGFCKAFAGRFEFKFNLTTDEYLGPVKANESDSFRDANGYLERVPVSYDQDGNLNYIDQSINWATERQSTKSEKGRKRNIMSALDFNWCGWVDNGHWPYKSVIRDSVNSDYLIYFYNRQSCIIDKRTGKKQHYNTRFLYNSSLRIDLDANPLIFNIRDHLAGGEIRLVKNKRQHWYEVPYKVNPSPNTSVVGMFVEMGDKEKTPCVINGTSPILSKYAYLGRGSDVCMSDWLHKRADGKNAHLFTPECGNDEIESSDLSYPQFKQNSTEKILNEISLHNLPRNPTSTELFYGIQIGATSDWEVFAKDGYTFTATTTVPIENSTDRVKVINLFSKYQGKENPKTQFDEYYPMPMLSIFNATYSPKGKSVNEWGTIKEDREKNLIEVKNLNYVDDIAYLHQCGTILIIFGVLYQELPHEKFGLEEKAPMDSIYHLGIWEPANAFFALPDSNQLWIYHRTNYVTRRDYTCADKNNPDALVTAKKGDDGGRYYARFGQSKPNWMPTQHHFNYSRTLSEESFFADLGLFKGSLANPEAPNPTKYPLEDRDPDGPTHAKNYTLLYVWVGIAVLIIVAMCVICLVTTRRWRKRHHRRSDPLASNATMRSGMADSTLGPQNTVRSSFPIGVGAGTPSLVTQRSAIQHPSSRASLASNRSAMQQPGSRAALASNRSALQQPGSRAAVASNRSAIGKLPNTSSKELHSFKSGHRHSKGKGSRSRTSSSGNRKRARSSLKKH